MKLKVKCITVLCAILFSLAFVGGVAKAAEELVFDSTDHYLGACSLTNKSEWTLKSDINVTTFEVWYSWSQAETELPVKVYKEGEKFAEFVAVRGSCDPYQAQWCNADYKINKVFPKGTYTTEIPTSKQCLKPGGTGAIRLYAEETKQATETNKVEEEKPQIEKPIAPPPVVVTSTPAEKPLQACSCPQTTIVALAAGSSLVVSLLVSLLFKRK